MNSDEPSAVLLEWYDQNARDLPWRCKPQDSNQGFRPDPYKVWLSEVMLQQTTVKAVQSYYRKFVDRWPDIHSLARAEIDDVLAAWAGLGYYSRAHNLHACARQVVDRYGGTFPQSEKELRSLPGIGRYIASALRSIAFDLPATVVDSNVERVMIRFHAIDNLQPQARQLIYRQAERLVPHQRAGDYAQALMDLGSTVCKPRSPQCSKCPWVYRCEAYRKGVQDEFPAPRKKAPKPIREGIMYVLASPDDCWLLERRPSDGLLGGTMGWPGHGWDLSEKRLELSGASLITVPGRIKHTFSHFAAHIAIQCGQVDTDHVAGKDLLWVKRSKFDPQSMPSLMKKAFYHAESYLIANAPKAE